MRESLSTATQAIGALPPDADAQLLVPVDAEASAADYKNLLENQSFNEFLNKIGDYATSQSNSPAMWDRRRKAVILRKYILGYFFGIYDKQKGFISGKEEGDGIYFDPQTPTAIENLVASLIKTKPQKKCEARSGDERIDKREAARVAEKLLQMDDDQDFTPKRQQREWKWNLLAAGETYRITYFNTQKQGCGIDEEVFERKVIEPGESTKHCALCDAVGSDESGKCPKCGNPQMDEFETRATTISMYKGSKFKQIGDVDWDAPDALEMTVIGETDNIAEALIVMRDRMIPACVLEDALGVSDLPITDTPDSLSYKQLFADKPESGDFAPMRLVHYQEFWVAPALVASYKFPKGSMLQGGEIPEGTKGKEIFENGLYFSRTKKKIREVFPQAIGECLSHATNSLGEGFHGHGEWDLIELQDQATEAKSMKMNSMLLDSTQPLLIREGYTDSENFENKFGLIVPVSQDFPLERELNSLMTRVPVGRPPSEAYELGQEIKGEIQQREGTFSTNSDAPDIKAMGTATGIDAITEQAVGRRGPALQLYAQMEVEQAYQKLELRQKYWCKKMYEPIAKELGGDAVKWFMDCNIRQDINITVVPGSWMPRTQTQQEEGLQKYLSIAGPIIAAKGDPKTMDDVLRKANELFGAGIDMDDMETQSIEAQIRLDKLRDVGNFAESQFGEMLYNPDGSISEQAIGLAYQHTADLLKISHVPADENDIFAMLPLDVMFDTHAEFEEAYTDWLRTADGRAASDFIRTLVRQLADYHVQAESYRQMKLKQYANLTQLPDLQASLIENAAMQSQATDLAAQDAANQPPMQQEPTAPAPMAEDQKLATTQAHEKELKQMDLQDKEAARQHDMAKVEKQQAAMPPQNARPERVTALG